MKKISAIALIASLTASTAFAGGMNVAVEEPMIDAPVVAEGGSSSNGGLLVLLLLGVGLAAAAASGS